MEYTEPHSSPRPSLRELNLRRETDELLAAPALQEVWGQLDQRGAHEREQGILREIIDQPNFQAVLTAVRALPATELAKQLQADLEISYRSLQASCPKTIHDLRQRMSFVDSNQPASPTDTGLAPLSAAELKASAEKRSAANTRDYLMQVMMAVKNLADFLEGRPPSDANTPLIQLFKQQEQRLARLLVAIEQDGQQQLEQEQAA